MIPLMKELDLFRPCIRNAGTRLFDGRRPFLQNRTHALSARGNFGQRFFLSAQNDYDAKKILP